MDAVQSPSPRLPPVPLHQPQSPSVAMLPPCTVCGEKASGFHYGANTCQACKVCTLMNATLINSRWRPLETVGDSWRLMETVVIMSAQYLEIYK